MRQTFDIRKMENAVVDSLRRAVGGSLSTIKQRVNGVLTDVPAVVRSNTLSSTNGKPAPRPSFPYIAVTYTGQTDAHDFSSLRRELDEDANLTYETEISVRLRVSVYGSDENTTDNIANQAAFAFKTDVIRNFIDREYGDEAGLLVKTVGDVLPTGIIYNNVETEVREFDVIFAVKNRITYDLEEIGYFREVLISDFNVKIK